MAWAFFLKKYELQSRATSSADSNKNRRHREECALMLDRAAARQNKTASMAPWCDVLDAVRHICDSGNICGLLLRNANSYALEYVAASFRLCYYSSYWHGKRCVFTETGFECRQQLLKLPQTFTIHKLECAARAGLARSVAWFALHASHSHILTDLS